MLLKFVVIETKIQEQSKETQRLEEEKENVGKLPQTGPEFKR